MTNYLHEAKTSMERFNNDTAKTWNLERANGCALIAIAEQLKRIADHLTSARESTRAFVDVPPDKELSETTKGLGLYARGS